MFTKPGLTEPVTPRAAPTPFTAASTVEEVETGTPTAVLAARAQGPPAASPPNGDPAATRECTGRANPRARTEVHEKKRRRHKKNVYIYEIDLVISPL